MAYDLRLEFDDPQLKSKLDTVLAEQAKPTFFFRFRSNGSGTGTHGKAVLLKTGQFKLTVRSTHFSAHDDLYSREELADTIIQRWIGDMLKYPQPNGSPTTFEHIRSSRGNLPNYIEVKYG